MKPTWEEICEQLAASCSHLDGARLLLQIQQEGMSVPPPNGGWRAHYPGYGRGPGNWILVRHPAGTFSAVVAELQQEHELPRQQVRGTCYHPIPRHTVADTPTGVWVLRRAAFGRSG